MTDTRSKRLIRTRYVKIGKQLFLVYGDERSGWSLDRNDVCLQAPSRFRYGSVSELVFALVNLCVTPEGQA